MDKSQGRVQAGAVPVRRGGGGTLCYIVKCPGGHFTKGVVYVVTVKKIVRTSMARG